MIQVYWASMQYTSLPFKVTEKDANGTYLKRINPTYGNDAIWHHQLQLPDMSLHLQEPIKFVCFRD